MVQKVDVGNAVKLLDQGDLFGALAWFADACRLELDDPKAEELLRIRLNSVLRYSPRLSQILRHDRYVSYAEFSPDAERILTVAFDTARVWNVATGEPVLSR